MSQSNSAAASDSLSLDCQDAIGRGESGRAPQIVTRLATREDVIEFFGKPQRSTMRAYVAVMDGKVVGVLGVVREEVGKYFCDFKPELHPYLKSITIMRAIKASMKLVADYQGPVVSVAEHAEGCRLLNRLGFTHLDGALYGWLN